MDAVECMKKRRSVREFQETPVEREIIEDLVDCGRSAATGINAQPWHFLVVQDWQIREQIAGATVYGRFIAKSPVCIAVFCEKTTYYLEDGSAATQNILNAATAYNLGSCWVDGDKADYAAKVCEILGAPPEYKLVSLIAIGYPSGSGNPPKKPLSEVLHWEKF